MKELSKNKKGIGVDLIIILIMVLIIMGVISYHIADSLYHKKYLTPICNNYGYEKATDSKKDYFASEFSTDKYYLWLECDNEIIKNTNSTWYDGRFIYSVTSNKVCSKRNKWGDCETFEYSHVIEVK